MVKDVIGAEYDDAADKIYFTMRKDPRIYSVDASSNCTTNSTVLLDVRDVGFDGVTAINLLYNSLYWIGLRQGDAFLVQSFVSNLTQVPFVVGHDSNLIKTHDFVLNAAFGQAIYYTSTNIYSFPGGSINPVEVYAEPSNKNDPFGLCNYVATYGTTFFVDTEGLKEFIFANVTFIAPPPNGVQLYSLRPAAGNGWPMVSVGLIH